jgi:hypothetical protein
MKKKILFTTLSVLLLLVSVSLVIAPPPKLTDDLFNCDPDTAFTGYGTNCTGQYDNVGIDFELTCQVYLTDDGIQITNACDSESSDNDFKVTGIDLSGTTFSNCVNNLDGSLDCINWLSVGDNEVIIWELEACHVDSSNILTTDSSCNDGLNNEFDVETCMSIIEDECNGIDEDCDDLIDEDYVSYTCGVGICEAESVCVSGEESCTEGDPETEICDGLDNDCDGSTDEYCNPEAECGDGYCDGFLNGEDCFMCSTDCKCTGRQCSKGCCGNGIIESKETEANCPIDFLL